MTNRLVGWILAVVTALSALRAGDDPAMKKKVRESWAAEDFSGLEKLAASCRADELSILDPFPRLSYFYEAIRGPGAGSDEEAARWLARLERWRQAHPESVTVRVALIDFYVTEAWRARGSGWAKDVPPENWKIFYERLGLAEKVLREPESKISADPTLAGFGVLVAMALSKDEETLKKPFDEARRTWPRYYPVYDNVARALLPRWGGKPKEVAAFAAASADKIGGPTGDGLYAMLAAMVLETEGADDFPAAGFDPARFVRGLDVLAEKGEPSYRYLAGQRAASVEAMWGDPGAARARIFANGPVFHPLGYGGTAQVRLAWEKCGAQAELNRGMALEAAGSLDEAGAFYAALTPVRPNFWLSAFALRNGVSTHWPINYGTPVAGLPLDKANPNQVFEMAFRAICAGDLDAACEYARAFDRERPHNLTGKYILVTAAALQNDRKTFDEEKARFLDLQTNRESYRVAQKYASGQLTWTEAKKALPRDAYSGQAFAMMGAIALGENRTAEAREIFRTVHEEMPLREDSAFPESMLWGALARKFPDRLKAGE